MLIPEVKKLMVKPFNEFYVVQPWSIDRFFMGESDLFFSLFYACNKRIAYFITVIIFNA